MNEIGARIRDARKTAKKTQREFSKSLGMSENYIWQIENGQREPSDRTVADICRVFGINETWLRTGEGEMRQQRTREEEIGEIAERASTVDPEKARTFFQRTLDGFSDAEIMTIYQIMRQRFPEE